MEVAANVLCLLAPWLSPFECRGAGDDRSEGGDDYYDVLEDLHSGDPGLLHRQQQQHHRSSSLYAEAAEAAGGAEAMAESLSEREEDDVADVAEAAMQNITNVTSTLLRTIRLASLPRTYQEWAALITSLGVAVRDYGIIVGRFVIKASVWHACLVVVILLVITAKLWTKFLSELMENLFRKPLRDHLGIEYDKIKVSIFRLSFSARRVELRPSESDLAKSIVVAIIPSADVTSPRLELEGEEYDSWGDKVKGKLQEKLRIQDKEGGHRRSGSGGRIDPAPRPFRGSNIKIEEIGLGCSFRLVRVRPLLSLARKWREYQDVTAASSNTNYGNGIGRPGDEKEKIKGTEKKPERTAYGDAKVRKPELSWLRFFTFYVLKPHVRVRVNGLRVEVDKTYLAPEPPEGYLPGHQHMKSASLLGEDTLNEVFSDESDTGHANIAVPDVVPAAIIPKRTLTVASVNGEAIEALPRFADQETLLRSFATGPASEANSIIFHMERWVEHTKKKGRQKNNTSRSLKGGGQTEIDACGDAKGGMGDKVKPAKNEKVSEGKDDDIMNLLLQWVLRLVISSVEVDCADMSLTISGADASTVQSAREENAVEPFRANMALSKMGWQQRALTFLSVQKVFVSFEGPDCVLNVGVSGISLQVGLSTSQHLSSPKRKYFQEGRNKTPTTSPIRKSNADDADKMSSQRTWHTAIQSDNNVKVEVSGALYVLVWALNYDHSWEKRKLGVDLVISNLSFGVEPLPLFTAMVHFDDYSDPNSSHGEWAAWLALKYQRSISPLSSQERATYRACYRKVQGIKGDPSKKKGERSKDDSSYDTTIQTEAQPLSNVERSSKKVNEGKSDKEVISALESRMTCEEILKERCSVLREKWRLSGSNPELQEFLRLTNSRLIDKKKSSVSKRPDTGTGHTTGGSSGLQTPFECVYRSPVDALVSLVREKFHLFAPTVDASLGIGSIQLHLIDRSFGDRRARMSDAAKKSTSLPRAKVKRLGTMPTTFVVRGTALRFHQQSIIFSVPLGADEADVERKKDERSPRPFQNVELTLDSAQWKPDVAVVGDLSLPTFINQDPCGLVYKSPHDAPDQMLSFDLDHRKDTNKTAASHLKMDVSAGHFIFIVNPIPLASSLAVLMSLAELPFRDLAAEKEARDIAELSDTADDNASSRQLTQFSFSAAESGKLADTAPPKGIILGGANICLMAQISRIAIVPLSDETSVNNIVLETTIENISVSAKSSKNGGERAEVSISPFKSQDSRILYAPTAQDEGMVRIFDLPFKPALDFGGASFSYNGRLRDDGGRAMSPAASRSAGHETYRNTFDIQLVCYVRRVVTNFSPTIDASLLGVQNCCNVFVSSLPAPEGSEPDLSNDSSKSMSGESEDSRRKALRELWMLADQDGSGTLSVDEVTQIIARLFSANSLNIYDELPKSQQPTEEELKREVAYFISMAGSSSAATRDLTFPEVDMLLFRNQELLDAGVSPSEHSAKDHDFSISEDLRGLIYYDDLLEYSSPSQVYKMTGVNDAQRFPPPSSWRKGQDANAGVNAFWELYERETGCSKASLNGQKISDVQRKLVRALLNYNFAKYCWKTLVKPALLQSQQEELATPTARKRAARRTTDWVLDKNTRTKFRTGAVDMFAQHVKKRETEIEKRQDDVSGSQPDVSYEVNLTIEMDEASVKIGNGLSFATPLVVASLARANITAFARLDPHSHESIFVPTVVEQGHDATANDQHNRLHFEFVVAANALNTKHSKMDDLVEPFSIFGNASYALKVPERGGDTEQGDKHNISCEIILPNFVSISVSPSAIETATKVTEIARQSSVEVYEALSSELQVQGVRDLWSFLDKDTSEDLTKEDIVTVMRHILGTDTGDDKSNEKIDSLIDSFLKTVDVDSSGTISFAEIEDQIRAGKITVKTSLIRLRNNLGVNVRFCCRSFMERRLARNPSITPTELISSFDSIRHDSARPVSTDLSSVEAASKDGIVIAVPGCRIIDVPYVVYQSLMVHLKSLKFVRRSRRRSRRDESQYASGFEPYLTLVPSSQGVDSITITARSSLMVEAETPINIRVVKVADLGILHGHKNKERDRTVNLTKKNLDSIFKQIVSDAQIVFEQHNLDAGNKVGLPINIMLSSSYHFLVVGDLAKDGHVFWRDPILLTRDYLLNQRHISEVVRCHAASGIAIHRNRLNVHRSSRSRRTSKVSKTRTAWDTSIVVMPSFCLTNALPFNIQIRCWQAPSETDDWKTEAVFRSPTTKERKSAPKNEDSDEERLTPDTGRRSRHRKIHSHAFEDAMKESRRAFFNFDTVAAGGNILLNGINMKNTLFIQFSQDCTSSNDIEGLLWTAPLSLDLKKLRAGGNRSGSLQLPPLKGSIGDDADFYVSVTVERSGIPYCSIFAPYWLNNKTGMKMVLKFSGRDDCIYDSGAGGLPIMAMCHPSEKKDSGDQREVCILPIEAATLDTAKVWWDEPTNGTLVLNHPPLNSRGKSLVDWSSRVGLDAVGTLGECRCRSFVFGVSIETLTGAFYQSNSIAFTPRYVVKNTMHIPITVLPIAGLLSEVEKMAKRMTDSGLDATLRKYKIRPDAFTSLGLDHSTIIYQFEDVSKISEEKDKDRYFLLRVDATSYNYLEQWHVVRADTFGSFYYVEHDGVRDFPAGIVKVDVQLVGPTIITSVMISPRSPFRIENRSNSQYIQFVQDDPKAVVVELPPMSFCSFSWDNPNPNSKKKLRVVSVPKRKSREYLTEQACRVASPTNPDADVIFDDSIADGSDGGDADEDYNSTSVTIDSSTRERLNEVQNVVAINTTDSQFIKRKRLYSRKSRSYDPHVVGRHRSLPYESPEESSSLLESHQKTDLVVELRIVAGSRVLSFNDSSWRAQQSEIGVKRSGGYWKGIEFNLFALGATFSLADDFPREIMSMTLRHFSLYKRKEETETTIRLRHIQVDSMFASAQYPVVLEPLPLGVDRRETNDDDVRHLIAKYYSTFELSPDECFWITSVECPMPFFEASLSYLPQEHMTWIPSLNIYLSPLKCKVELSYLLRIADLLMNSLPEPSPEEVLTDTLNTLSFVNHQLEYPSRSGTDATLTYIEKFSILPTYIDIELDVKSAEGASEDDDDMDDMIALSSLGKQTSSNLSAGLLAWVNNVAAKFAHVSPKFKYDGMERADTYANAEDLANEIVQYYIVQTVYQSYKVVFSMQLFGDPQELFDHYKAGISDLGSIATREQDVGKGLTSATRNVFGGTLDFAGKITGEFSGLLDSLATNEYTSKDLKPKKSAKNEEAPGNIGEGVIDGTTFLGQTLFHGVAGVVGNPYRGLKKGSAKAVAKGVASGVGGLVVAPLVGALGFTAKVLEGTGNTTSLLEVGVIESRCRPVRIVRWGASLGQVVLPYVKGIGIRIHQVRYQKKYKGAREAAGTYDEDDESTVPQTAREFRQAKAAEDKRRNPARKAISMMRLRDKDHILTTARKPKLLEDDEDGSVSPEVSRYVIVYEETLTLRCSDMQLSDVIAVYLWNYKSIVTTSSRNKPLGLCKFTIGDVFASLQQYYSEQIQRMQVDLSDHSTVNSRKDSTMPTASTPSNASAPLRSGFGLEGIERTRQKQEALAADLLPAASVDDSPTCSFLPTRDDSNCIMPPIQEYALMKPVPRKSRSMHNNLASTISEEMASIKRAEERAMAFFESDTDEYSESDSDTNTDDQKIVDEDEEEAEKSMEHLQGHIMLSSFPIPW